MKTRFTLVVVILLVVSSMFTLVAGATSQWSKKTGMQCNACHTVFPRLNDFGQRYLQNGYQLGFAGVKATSQSKKEVTKDDDDDIFLEKINNLFGFRVNLTPVMLETKALQKKPSSEKQTAITIGNANWLQMFVAGSIYKDISFFSELEHNAGSFKFNWFYFNFTNLFGSKFVNFNVGNTTPLLFASYPDRLPQLPNIKGEVFARKASGGSGDNSVDMRGARMSIQYYAYNDFATLYAGVTPGSSGIQTKPDQKLHYWGGIVFRLPDDVLEGFEGSTFTLHYYSGNSTKNSTDTSATIFNDFTRISPQINIRWNEKIDLQAAYVMASDDNFFLTTAKPTEAFKYSGMAVDLGYMPNDNWHFGVHYDSYKSDKKVSTDQNALFEYGRFVPVATYIVNQNIRFSVYFEKLLKSVENGAETPTDALKDKIYINMRTMF